MTISLSACWRLLVIYLRPQRGRVLLLAAVLLSSIGLQLVSPQVLRHFIDLARAGAALHTLAGAAALFAGLALAGQGLSVVATYTSENIGWTATNALRNDLVEHCLRLDLAFHRAHTPGEMIERVDGDVTALANFFSQFVVQLLGSALLLIGVIVALARIDARVGAVMAVFAVLSLAAFGRMRDIAVPHWTAARQAAADWSGFLEERLAGAEDLRANGAVANTVRRFVALMRERLSRERRAGLMSGVMGITILVVITIGTILALLLGAWLFRAGLATLGAAYIVYHYTQMIFQPLMEISRQLEDLQSASAGMARIQALRETPAECSRAGRFCGTAQKQDRECALYLAPEQARGAGSQTLPAGALAVEFAGVSFSYNGDEAVLHDLSFVLRPGRVLGVLGRTGSGKTTLTRLLLRLYAASAGTIRLGGIDIGQAALTDLRNRVTMVTQDVQLFQASLRDNLTLFRRGIPDSLLREALGELGLWEWYRSLPQGLDTELAAGGGLSAGQAQLLAFARAFLRDPGLVILDEASSRLDRATEQMIERAVGRLLQGRTGIIIAHRLNTVQRADEVLILEGGRCAEYGERARLAADPRSRFAGLLAAGLEEALA